MQRCRTRFSQPTDEEPAHVHVTFRNECLKRWSSLTTPVDTLSGTGHVKAAPVEDGHIEIPYVQTCRGYGPTAFWTTAAAIMKSPNKMQELPKQGVRLYVRSRNDVEIFRNNAPLVGPRVLHVNSV